FQSFAGQPYHARVVATDMLYVDVEDMQDSVMVQTLLSEIDSFAKIANDPGLVWEARLARAYYNLRHGPGSVQDKTAQFKAFVDSAAQERENIIQARALKLLTFTYWDHNSDYEKLFKTYHELEDIISRLSPSQ